MSVLNRRESFLLFLGDIFFLYLSLWVALLIRHAQIPQTALLESHLLPFSILFIAWLLSFLIAGLYEKHTLIFKKKLPSTILRAQIANTVIAILFFYLIPLFEIAPKTNLFIYLAVSFGLILFWRNVGIRIFGARRKQNGMLIGTGEEMHELQQEINGNSRYNLRIVSSLDLNSFEGKEFYKEIIERIYAENISIVIIDVHNKRVEPVLSHLYKLIFSQVDFIDMYELYEEIFNRIPLSMVRYHWFLEKISFSPKPMYDTSKRLMDICLSLVLGVFSLLFYPFAMVAIYLEERGNYFYFQERLGQQNKLIRIFKFRTMQNTPNEDGKKRVTKVGKVLRQTRIDELPQLWNVLKGDLSLIGPRPEIPELAQVYEEELPYYNVRHLVKPGLSGWAQLNQKTPPKFQAQSEATKVKLSYDLFYIKNRSIFLDLKIALRTIRTLLSRSGV